MAAQKNLRVKSSLLLLVLSAWMSDWKWIAPVSVHRQHICGLICLLLRKADPWAVSSQWPHSRRNSGTVMLHVTVYDTLVHLPRKQPSNLCGKSISAFLKVAFQAECTDLGHFDSIKNMTGSTFWQVFMIFDTSTDKPSSQRGLEVFLLNLSGSDPNKTTKQAHPHVNGRFCILLFAALNQVTRSQKW